MAIPFGQCCEAAESSKGDDKGEKECEEESPNIQIYSLVISNHVSKLFGGLSQL